MTSDSPKHRPLERFWPYADLPEQPTDEELAALDPDLQDALFDAKSRPFSITLVFAAFEGAELTRALELARQATELSETGSGPHHRYRARFAPEKAGLLHQLFMLVGNAHTTDVLIDDRPVPFARELWLPLVWFLLPRS